MELNEARGYVKQFLLTFRGLQKVDEVMDILSNLEASQKSLTVSVKDLSIKVDDLKTQKGQLESDVFDLVNSSNVTKQKIQQEADAAANIIITDATDKTTVMIMDAQNRASQIISGANKVTAAAQDEQDKINTAVAKAQENLEDLRLQTATEQLRLSNIKLELDSHKKKLSDMFSQL